VSMTAHGIQRMQARCLRWPIPTASRNSVEADGIVCPAAAARSWTRRKPLQHRHFLLLRIWTEARETPVRGYISARVIRRVQRPGYGAPPTLTPPRGAQSRPHGRRPHAARHRRGDTSRGIAGTARRRDDGRRHRRRRDGARRGDCDARIPFRRVVQSPGAVRRRRTHVLGHRVAARSTAGLGRGCSQRRRRGARLRARPWAEAAPGWHGR